jgi:sugar-specific transcriptional regulator TrmB
MSELSEKTLIKHIINKDSLTDDIEGNIMNKLWNLGFLEGADFEIMAVKETKWKKLIKRAFENEFHAGLMVGILLNSKNNLIDPFSPLKKFPKEDKEVQRITEQLETDILHFRHHNRKTKKNRTNERFD